VDIKSYSSTASAVAVTPTARRADVDVSAPEKRTEGAVPVRDPGVVVRVNGGAEATPVYGKPRESRSAAALSARRADPSANADEAVETSDASSALKQMSDAVERAVSQTANRPPAQEGGDPSSATTNKSPVLVDTAPKGDRPEDVLNQAEQILAQIAAREGSDEGERKLAARALTMQAAAKEALLAKHWRKN
jgi:hypothetical protein